MQGDTYRPIQPLLDRLIVDGYGDVVGIQSPQAVGQSLRATQAAQDTLGNTLIRGASRVGNRVVLYGDSLNANNNVAVAITSISVSAGVVTVVCGSAHGQRDGQLVNISGTTNTTFHARLVPVIYLSSTSFSYLLPTATGASSATGVVLCQNQFSQNGCWVWGNAELDQRMRFVANLGVGGENTDQMLARWNELWNLDFDILDLEGGTNDIVNDLPTATTIANLKAMLVGDVRRNIKGALQMGKLVILKTITPIATGGVIYTGARNAAIQNVNEWIKRTAARMPGVVLVDAYRALVDSADAVNGYGVTAYYQSGDTVHFNSRGARRIGALYNTALASVIRRYEWRASSPTDCYGVNTINRNLFDKAPWDNTGAAATGPATGTVATGWVNDAPTGTFAVNPAFSLVARSDGYGYNIRCVATPGAAGASWNVRTNASALNARLPSFVSKKYRWLAEITVSGSSTGSSGSGKIRFIELRTAATIGTPTGVIGNPLSGVATANQISIDQDGTFSFASPEFLIPAGAVAAFGFTLQVTYDGDATGNPTTIDIGCVKLQPMDDD